MIIINNNEIRTEQFEDLLQVTKQQIDNDFKQNGIPKSINGLAYEEIVFTSICKAANGSNFEGHIERTGLISFPDIIARKIYGLEVKMVSGNNWVSNGNSVLETTRIQDVEKIYLFFGKFGKNYEAKYRKYQDCLSEVIVTHSPRYKVDMNIGEGNSIFDKIKIDYDDFRKNPNQIKLLKEYYRNQLSEGEELWWIDAESENISISPVIKPFSKLDEAIKKNFVVEAMILFPEIFGNSSTKFERVAAYLITRYNCVCANVRDIFTAGGTKQIIIGNELKTVSRINYRLYENIKIIESKINEIPKELLLHYWQTQSLDNDILSQWCENLQKHSPLALQIARAGFI